MLEFHFMRKALLAGFLLSIMIPAIGVVMVNRKTSMIGDALSHCALMGVGMGLILGFDPLIGMIIICILASFAIEVIRDKFPQFGDMATAVAMSLGLGAFIYSFRFCSLRYIFSVLLIRFNINHQ